MSDKAEELARQLLEKTEIGKLRWNFVPKTRGTDEWADSEKYETDLEGVYSFCIHRTTAGDNKVIGLELTSPSGVLLSAHVDNFPFPGDVPTPYLRSREVLGGGSRSVLAEPADASKVARFRLFSDLFHSARKNAVAEGQTIEKVQQLLEGLGKG